MPFDHLAYVRSDHPDLTHRQMAMLITIQRQGKSTVRGLAEALDVQKPVITRATTTLARLDLVVKRRDVTDKRNVFISLTRKGERFMQEVFG